MTRFTLKIASARPISDRSKNLTEDTVMTRFITRACLAASAVLCFAIEPASAQYNIFNSQSGPVTDVIVNGRQETLASVREFEQRCQIGMAAGRWWLDNNGNIGPVGGPATYNINTCEELGQYAAQAPPRMPPPRSGPVTDVIINGVPATPNEVARCTFFPPPRSPQSGGSICSGPGFR